MMVTTPQHDAQYHIYQTFPNLCLKHHNGFEVGDLLKAGPITRRYKERS